MLLLASKAEGHNPELCEETTQQLQGWADHEFSGLVVGQIQEALLLWQEACRNTTQATEVHSTNSGSSPRYTGGIERWRPLVTQYFESGKVETALCILFLESRGDPEAANPTSTAAGLFQFLRSTWDRMVPISVTGGSYDSGQVYQPEANVRSAAWLQRNAGWTQWSPWNRGLCRGL